MKDASGRNPDISVRTLANKFKTNASTLQSEEKLWLRFIAIISLHSVRWKKVPRREEKQENFAICCSKLLYKKLCAKKFCLIIDDKTYCAAYIRSLQGHQYYSANNRTL